MVGLPPDNEAFVTCIRKNREYIQEVYFSWGDFPSGRSSQTESRDFTAWERQECQVAMLRALAGDGISLNLLMNANCYGRDSMSRAFYEKIGTTVCYIQDHFGLTSVTTTSPLIARFLKDNFDNLEIRASVNMEIGTVQGMDYLAEYFDSYYLKRELNRDLEEVSRLHAWCERAGKKLYLLANSGCLNHCSAHNFHDNLVAHEGEIAQMDNAYSFGGICRDYLKKKEHYGALINDTSFIRPEDIWKYEGKAEGVKLATRSNRNPAQVLMSYIQRRYSGNILELLEPAHSIYPYVVENGEPLRLVKIGGNDVNQ